MGYLFSDITPLARMAEEVYEVNEANGWFEDERSFGDDIALLHSELSEALEAYRDSHGFEDQTLPNETSEVRDAWNNVVRVDIVSLSKPEGVGSELADVLIRLLDTAKRRGIDLDAEYQRKLAFNRTRGHRHGGKLL